MNDNNDTNKYGRIKNRIPLIVYLIVLIIVTVMINNVGGVFFYALFFSAFLYLPVSFIYILYIKANLLIYQELDSRLLYKGRAERYKLNIENGAFVPAGGIRLGTTYGISVFTEDFTCDSYELLSHEKMEIATDIILRYAGSYEAGITEIILSDVFGIINYKYHIPAPLRVSVLPSVTDVAERPLNRLLDEMSGGRRTLTSDQREDALGNDLRAYIKGDPVKQIHWKNYARSGELFVRLPDMPDAQMPTIFLIPELSEENLKSIERRDYFLELAVSVANYFAKRKKPVSFIFDGLGDDRILVENYESFQRFYTELEKRINNAEKNIGRANDTNAERNITDEDSLLILREKDNTLCLSKKLG